MTTTTDSNTPKPIHPARIYVQQVPEVLGYALMDFRDVRRTLSDLWPFTWKVTASRAVDDVELRSFRNGREWEREHLDEMVRAVGPAASAWLDTQS